MAGQGRVAVLMGSESDDGKMQPALSVLRGAGVLHHVEVMSAHREPDRVAAFAKGARGNGYSVIICGAGLAAHLAGAVAANTDLPVIGVPLSGGIGGGQDALLATVQMPKGVPVATVGVDNSANAAWLAIRILGTPRSKLAAGDNLPPPQLTGEVVSEGKTKTLFATADPGHLVMRFNDDVTANNGEKHEVMAGKGATGCAFNTKIMLALAAEGIRTHYRGSGEKPNEAIVQRLDMIPLECVVRNRAAGSFCRRLAVDKGLRFSAPLYELFYKSDELNDPLVTEDTAVIMGWATYEQLGIMRRQTLRVNTVVGEMLRKHGIELVDFKIEFGVSHGLLLVGDEFSPDSCRMWDLKTGDSLDKDLFRQSQGGFLEACEEVLGRMSELTANEVWVHAAHACA
jgi:phosphoribosylaminoimidazole-succinocarboxamide synthase